MAMTQLKPPGSLGAKSSQNGPADNFAKALLEAGGHVVESTVDASLSMVGDAMGQLFGGGTTSNSESSTTDHSQDTASNNPYSAVNQERLWAQEDQEREYKRREMRMLRHREIQQTNVFDRRQVETERKIEQLTNELDALAKDLDATNRKAREVQIAAMQNNVTPGDYHLNMVERLIKIVMLLRRSVGESASWLDMFNGRKAQQNSYWGQFHSKGMQWAMSQERALATSVG